MLKTRGKKTVERVAVFEVVEAGKNFWRDAKITKEQMDEWEEWNSPKKAIDNLKTAVELFGRAMICVEAAVKGTGEILSSAEKRSAAAKILDEMVPLPGIAEMLDGPAFEWGLGWIAGIWNTKVGHEWPTE